MKLALFLLLLGVLVHVVNRWSEADRRYLAALGRRAWLVSRLIVLPLVIFEGELKTSLVSALPGQETKDFVLVWKPVSNAAVIILVVTAFPLLGHAISTGSAKKYFYNSLVGLLAAVFASDSTSALFGLVAGLFIWFLYARYTRQTAKFLTVASARDTRDADLYTRLQTIPSPSHAAFPIFRIRSFIGCISGISRLIVLSNVRCWVGVSMRRGPFRGYRSSSDPLCRPLVG